MRTLATLAILLFVAACQAPPPEMTEAGIAQMEAEVRQAITDRWVAFEDVLLNRDLTGFSSYWTPDIRIVEPGMDMSREELVSSLAEFWESGGENFSWEMESYEIFIHGDVAYQIGQYDESLQWPDREPEAVANYFFARWQKQPDGVWMMDRFVFGPRPAPPEG